MRSYIIAAALFAATAAFATNNNNNDTFNTADAMAQASAGAVASNKTSVSSNVRNDIDVVNKTNNQVNSTNRNNNNSNAVVTTNGDNINVTNSGSPVNVNTTVDAPNVPKIKQVPDAIAPSIIPTSPCMGSSSVAASWMGGGIGGGSSWTDDHCSYRETARLLDALGFKDDAITVLCQSKFAQSAAICKNRITN